MFCVHLRGKHIVLLDGMSYKYQLSLSHLVCHLKLCSLLHFCVDDLSVSVSWVLKSPTTIVLLLISL